MSRFTWGDTVRVKEAASDDKRPGSFAAIVGIREAKTVEHARELDVPVGTKVYQIEFSDGSAIEIPEGLLEPSDP